MIIFELFRQLDVLLLRVADSSYNDFASCSKYVLKDDSLILLGLNYSIRLNMANHEIVRDIPLKNWDIDTEPVLWFAQDSAESIVIRLIHNAYSYWQTKPTPENAQAYFVFLQQANQVLAGYNIRILMDEEGLCAYQNDAVISFEKALEIIMDSDTTRLDEAGVSQLMYEAGYYKDLDRWDDASIRLEKVISLVDHLLPSYTQAAWMLAQVYYYAGNYARAEQILYRCRMEFIKDEEDLYSQLGHVLLDHRMKKFERQIRIYYRGLVDEHYAQTHPQAIEAAATEVEDVFDDYEKTCRDMGRKKYAEFRNRLPVGADDIDELLMTKVPDKVKEFKPEKNYENIVLMKPTFTESSGKMSGELLSKALQLMIDGEYQESFSVYCRLAQEVDQMSDTYSWVEFQLAKLYSFFDDYTSAMECLTKCNPTAFGMVYRLDDFLILYAHVRTILSGMETEYSFRKLMRGRLDFYFARYDRAYIEMLHDRPLQADFRDYEKDCERLAKEELKGAGYAVPNTVNDTPAEPKGFFARMKSHFFGK